jgi:hypothetical protein
MMNMMYQCANCEGSGYFDLPDDTEKACSVCGGAGEVDYDAAIARANAAEAEAARLRAERDDIRSWLVEVYQFSHGWPHRLIADVGEILANTSQDAR